MPTDLGRSAAIGAGIALLAGCAQAPLEMGKASTLGEANRQTFNAQVVDPVPTYDYAVPEGSGQKAAAAIERYRTDKIKQPDEMRTSTVGTAGGSGGK